MEKTFIWKHAKWTIGFSQLTACIVNAIRISADNSNIYFVIYRFHGFNCSFRVWRVVITIHRGMGTVGHLQKVDSNINSLGKIRQDKNMGAFLGFLKAGEDIIKSIPYSKLTMVGACTLVTE